MIEFSIKHALQIVIAGSAFNITCVAHAKDELWQGSMDLPQCVRTRKVMNDLKFESEKIEFGRHVVRGYIYWNKETLNVSAKAALSVCAKEGIAVGTIFGIFTAAKGAWPAFWAAFSGCAAKASIPVLVSAIELTIKDECHY